MLKFARRLLPLLAAASTAVVAGHTAEAQDTYTLRFNHVLGPTEPFHEGFMTWAKRIEERTDGELKMEVYHSAQLGVEEDIIEQIGRAPMSGGIATPPASATMSPVSQP